MRLTRESQGRNLDRPGKRPGRAQGEPRERTGKAREGPGSALEKPRKSPGRAQGVAVIHC